MARARATTPAGHGELLTRPAFSEWAGLARANAAAAQGWSFLVDGVPASEVRALARADALAQARAFSARLGVPVAERGGADGLIVATGHQPELYHTGVWVKDFLLQRLSEEAGATALDLVVDSDGFESVGVHSPCFKPEVRVCRAYLAVGTADGCFGCTPVPASEDIETFIAAAGEQLATLTAPAPARHFAQFAEHLRGAAHDANDLAELVTFARRRYEASAGTDYLELPVSAMAGTEAFARLVAQMGRDAERFAAAYNGALGEYRARTGTRSAAQPFPDLRVDGDLVELPLWHLASARRTVWARTGDRPALVVDGEEVCLLAERDGARAVLASGLRPAPKALALTLFARLFVSDFFIHGVGGSRYDQVTDDVMRRYFGIEPPAYGVASLTMYLPLGGHLVTDEEIDVVTQALNRLRHNPDQMLDDVEFDTAAEHDDAVRLAAQKASLVERIAEPDADRKALGAAIRERNEALAEMLEPYRRQLADELDELLAMQAASEVLTDRTYPLCFWSPAEVADKAR